MNAKVVDDAVLAALREWDTPMVCNALEVVAPERRGFGFTQQTLVCARPQLPPMVGYARTCMMRSVEPARMDKDEAHELRMGYYAHLEQGPAPRVVVVQDLDGGRTGAGAMWGEVQSNIHKGLGCLGVVTDGSVRDMDAIADGFQFLAAHVVPSHIHNHVVAYDCEVNVCGMVTRGGDLVHADRHGAVIVPHDIAAEVAETCVLLARKEKVIIEAARKPGFDFAALKKAWGDADDIH